MQRCRYKKTEGDRGRSRGSQIDAGDVGQKKVTCKNFDVKRDVHIRASIAKRVAKD